MIIDIIKNREPQEPISRIWACFFVYVTPINFVYVWKFKKLTKYLLIITPALLIVTGIFVRYMLGPTTGNILESITNIALREFIGILIWYMAGVCLISMFYPMFGWATEYNLKHFGYKSKKEWKKHHR